MISQKNNEGIRAIWATKYKHYVAGKYTRAREYDKYEILNKIEKTQLLFTAVTTNTRPQEVFSSVQTCDFSSTRRKMSAFKPCLKYYFATGSDTASCQDYEEYEFVECVSYNHISFLNTRWQLVWVLATSGFYWVFIQINKQPGNIYVNYREYFVYFTQLVVLTM